MFKKLLSLSMICFLSVSIYAQDEFKSSTYLGIIGGVSASRVSFTPSVSQDLLISSYTGIFLRHISEPNLGLQFEVSYSGRGWIEDHDSAGTYKRLLRTIDVPLMAVYVIGKKTLRLSIALGPYVSYIQNEKERISITDSAFILDYYQKPLHNKWEFGLTAGTGIEFHTRAGVFAIRGSYFNSLSNLFPLNISEFYYRASRSQFLQVGVGYYLKL